VWPADVTEVTNLAYKFLLIRKITKYLLSGTSLPFIISGQFYFSVKKENVVKDTKYNAHQLHTCDDGLSYLRIYSCV
jgi:hypothetical protein